MKVMYYKYNIGQLGLNYCAEYMIYYFSQLTWRVENLGPMFIYFRF
jgi:hypothetical protein